MMDLEVYAIVHCRGVRWLYFQTSNCSLTDRCQQFSETEMVYVVKQLSMGSSVA